LLLGQSLIYRYHSDQQPRDLQTLTAKKWWSSRVDTLNDPSETQALRSLDGHPAIQAEFRNIGVICFSRALTNPLMWAHYAAGHRGYAVAYDGTHTHFGMQLGSGQRYLLDVRYEDALPSLDFLSPAELKMAAVLTKPTCWAYEQEMRLVSQQGGQLLDAPVDAIRWIIFGAEMPKGRVTEIMQAIHSAHIRAKFVHMGLATNHYGVAPHRVQPGEHFALPPPQ
jgi:Protein of unknown function (DUF2971)